MKIHLQNIKCYDDQAFDFGDGGLALLSGQSGKGKSTIIQGIYFALFGTGSKITSFGKTSCSVTLEFDGIKVHRSKGPGRLIVNDVIEGDAAQQLINQKFGDTFDVTGYIPQNAIKSFIMMSPSDKLGFLERFAFEETDLQGIKNRCKEYVSATSDKLSDATSKLEVANQFIDEIEEPEFVEFPIPVKNNNYEKAIKNEDIRLKNTKVLITGSENRLVKMKDTLSRGLNTVRTINDNHNEIRICEDELVNTSMDTLTIEDGDIALYKNQLDTILANTEYNKLNKLYTDAKLEFETIRDREEHDRIKELDELNAGMWLMYTQVETDEIIAENETLMKDVQRRNNLLSKYDGDIEKDSIDDLKIAINEYMKDMSNIRLSKESHSCPSCKTKVRFMDNSLVVVNVGDIACDRSVEEVAKELRRCNSNLSILTEVSELESLYDDFPPLDDIRSDIKYMRDYKFEQLENAKRISSISKCVFSETCMSFSRKCDKYKSRIDSLSDTVKDDTDITMTESELRDKINELSNHIKEIEYSTKRRNDLNSRLDRYKNKNIELFDIIGNPDNLEDYINNLKSDIEIITNELDGLYLKRNKHERNMSKIEEWKRAKDDMKKYTSWEEKVLGLQEDESVARDEYGAAMSLRDKILEAESIAMINLVESINTHARVYLEDFFEDDPIVVNLRAFKKVQNVTKAQVSMDIEYKGMECDFQMLSGGEMSRIVLAYTLALAEMFNSPLLLLDECTASLDQETTNHVFDSIKEHFGGKLTIIVAHQVVTGIFDRSVSLDN